MPNTHTHKFYRLSNYSRILNIFHSEMYNNAVADREEEVEEEEEDKRSMEP